MAGRRIGVLDIREMVRRFRLGEADRAIAQDLGAARNTVAKYHEWARREGFLDGPELAAPGVIEERLAALPRPALAGPESTVEPYREFVTQKRAEGVELKALFGLMRERGFDGSYSALRRFVRRLEKKPPETFLRIETPPGHEAQVDFGYVGELVDPVTRRLRKAWVFVMTLSFSRHQYAEIVFDQRIETWVALHVRAFESFGGVVRRVVLDNLKAGIVKAVLHDAEAQRSYRELAEAYGFLIAPCRPRTPRHKGKVESGVRFVKRNALAGREFRDSNEANAHLARWVREVAGVRDHGTTHEAPLARFEAERPHLPPLPARRYEVAAWKEAKLHPDCHVVFEGSYYSAPHRLVGSTLWLRALPGRVELFHEHALVATHPRAGRRGQWSTSPHHLPPEKLQGLLPEPVELRTRAKLMGSSVSELIDRLLGERPLDRLRSAQGILGLARRFGAERLDAACRRALDFDEVRYHTVKTILKKGLDLETAAPPSGPLPKTSIFARPASDFLPLNSN
jgi:transposase